MKDLGIDVELYVSSEVDSDAIKVSMHKLVGNMNCATIHLEKLLLQLTIT